MKKIKVIIKKNYKIIIAFILGITISIVGVYAETILLSSDVYYDNSKSGGSSTTVQGAIEELYGKAKTHCPDGYICSKQDVNANIVKAYTYNSSTCITGEESACEETNCINYTNAGSCPAGTIIKYKVNDSEEKYFHVLHDDGATMTLQQRENTTDNTAWYETSPDNTQGPTTILPVLESATSGWSNVEDQTYTMGTTKFGSGNNAYTGCTSSGTCNTNTYTLGKRTAKARMITMQEATALGCITTSQSCPNWMNNYLYNSTNYGLTVNDATDSNGKTRYGYWTMSATSSDSGGAWRVGSAGRVFYNDSTDTSYGARAVVVVSK